MRIVLFTHPAFLASQSMPRFAQMLRNAYTARGHEVQVWSPPARVRRWVRGPLSKWAGYVDQYLLFPLWVRRQLARAPEDTLFVMTDQALGPWVPLVRGRPLVVHVHDLLALRSALGEIPENRTGASGRVYQRYIRRGFQQARHFICISQRTREDLRRVGGIDPLSCEVVYNGLNQRFARIPAAQARVQLRGAGMPVAPGGLLLHVSGGQWYKNVAGVLRLYAHYARAQRHPLPLWLVGVPQTEAVQAVLREVPEQGTVHFLYGIDHALLQAAYSVSRAFLFPSLAEGFGWPIVEAQACGCPVLTTDDTPMNEIGGPHTTYLRRLRDGDDGQAWAAEGARRLEAVVNESVADAQARSQTCMAWARRFDADRAIGQYLQVYGQVLAGQQVSLNTDMARTPA